MSFVSRHHCNSHAFEAFVIFIFVNVNVRLYKWSSEHVSYPTQYLPIIELRNGDAFSALTHLFHWSV